MNREKVKSISNKMQEKMNELEKELGITIQLKGKIRFDEDSFDIGYSVIEVEKGDDETLYNNAIQKAGMEDVAPKYGTQLTLNDGHTYKVVGFKPRATKNKIVIEQLNNKKQYVTSIATCNKVLGVTPSVPTLTIVDPPK